MKAIKPSFELVTPFGPLTPEIGLTLLRFVEAQARISHRAEDKQTDETYRRFIQAHVLEHGDWSVTEHAHLTAILRVDRGVTHELVRHRLFSFTQESTRFVNYGKREIEFIYPAEMHHDFWPDFWLAMSAAETTYLRLLKDGVRPQEARCVLPNATAATIAVTGNLRTWRWFFLARTSRETHPDFRRVTIPMLQEFKNCIPLLYDDIEPEARQIDNFQKAH